MMQNQESDRKGFRFNWGTGIALSFVIFCTFVILIVISAFQQDIDLVSDTYYLDELAYQERITERTNLERSGEEVTISQTAEYVTLEFPQSFSSAIGEIYFYHPSRKLFDKHYTIKLNENIQKIPKQDLIKGNYKIKINWKVGEKPYFQEHRIFLQ